MDVFTKGNLIEKVLAFCEESDLVLAGLFCKKVYYQHVPAVYPTVYIGKRLLAHKLDKAIPPEALYNYV